MADGTCTEPDCELTRHKSGKGRCGKHYVKALRSGQLPRQRGGPKTCSHNGCTDPYYSGGYCRPHYEWWRKTGDPEKPTLTVEERFWSKVDKQGDNGCWLWTAALSNHGHGRFMLDGQCKSTHRLAYEWLVGPIPDGLVLDHQCHNNDPTCWAGNDCLHRRCVNPAHLEATTQQINNLRGHNNGAKTHCPQGHPYDAANTWVNEKTGHRFCLACRNARNAARCRKAA